MSKEYRRYDETPTLIWFGAIMVLAVASLICAVLIDMPSTIAMILFSTGIVLSSIGVTIFIMTIIYPAVAEKFHKPRHYEDE